ncbi:MAG: SDR family NAD(P)-dependent oxidoreductase [Clostridia bacterium]|nr:SDR family NAD(P)-dependent oxidoreductase [Clostridia bacterium]
MNKRIVITGASDGIGFAAARRLKELGNEVIIAGRSPEKTQRRAEEIGADFFVADYTRLSDVIKLAEELKKYGRIDVLCNNAGGITAKKEYTEDGFEKTFQLNVLGGFLLTTLLKDVLTESNATVVQTASIAANLFGADLDADDLQTEKNFSPVSAYGHAKLEDILFTRELDRRFGALGINAVAFEPGVVRTNFASEANGFMRVCYHSPLKYLFTISPDKRAERLVRLALGSAGGDFVRGETYSYKKPLKLKFFDDGTAARKLWEFCALAVKKYI